MAISRSIPLLLLALTPLLAAGCSGGPAASPASQTPAVKLVSISLLQVPLALQVPAALAPSLRVTDLAGEGSTYDSVAASRVTYVASDKVEQELARLYWYETPRLAQVGTAPGAVPVVVVGGRTLAVAEVAQVYASDSPEGLAFARARDLLRQEDAYRQFACPTPQDWPKRPVTQVVADVVTAYFLGKDLLPVKIEAEQESVLSLDEQSNTLHSCFNPDGGEGAYVGVVPSSATEAVMVYVHHKAYPATGAESTFVTVAKIGGSWKVVGEGTGP